MRLAILIALAMSIFAAAALAAETLPPPGTPVLMPGRVNNCAAKYYPPSAIHLGEQGATILKLQIGETGIVSKVDVVRSSGFPDLDKASVDCVATAWRFTPATRNGKPVPSTKEYKIVWKLSSGPQLVSNVSDFCQSDVPKTTSWSYAGKDAILEYRVASDGHVEDPFIVASSGDSGFDQFAVRCISKLNYAPLEGMPSGISWGAEVLGGPSGVFLGDGHGVTHVCSTDIYPSAAADKADRSVIIGYRVITGGVAAATAVEQSSGNGAFDRAAQACVQQWRYSDRLFEGPNVFTKMHAHITRKNGHVYVYESLAK